MTEQIKRTTGLAIAIAVIASLALIVAYPLAQADVDLTRRVAALETVDSSVRLAKLETRLDSIESIVKGVLICVLGQLVLSGVGLSRQRGKG